MLAEALVAFDGGQASLVFDAHIPGLAPSTPPMSREPRAACRAPGRVCRRRR